MKSIELKTEDGVKIAADFYPAKEKSAPAVVLLHMMPSTKESWKNFAKKLNKNGFQCLAIDLRGHGESEKGPEGFREFSDEEHQKSIYDVRAAVDFFISKGLGLEKIALAGASIGANLSLWFQAENPEIKASILLSPGLSYRGIDTEPFAKKINPDQSVYLAAGGENDEYSTETVRKLFNLLKSENKQLKVFPSAGHGTSIFLEYPEFMDELAQWLKESY